MNYASKRKEKAKLRKLAEHASWAGGSYYDEDKKRYIRVWKSAGRKSLWAVCKRVARKKARLFLKKNGFYSKNADDLWWNVW